MYDAKPLLGRVIPFEGESLVSLLTRASGLNGFRRPAEFPVFSWKGGQIKPAHCAFTRDQELQSAVAKLLGLGKEAVGQVFHSVVQREGLAEAVLFNGTLLPRRYIEAKTVRFSPTSFRKAIFCRSIWSVRPIQFCPDSMELLLDSCQCGHKLAWAKAIDVHTCDACGRSLRKGRVSTVAWDIRDAANLATSLIHHSSEVREAALANLPEPFRSWESGDAFVAVVELGDVLRDLNEGRLRVRGRDSFDGFTASHLVAGYRAVKGWPESFHDIVRRCSAGRSGTWRSLVGPLRRFFNPETPTTRLHLLIRETVPELFGTGAVVLSSYKGARSKLLTNSVTITERAAAREFDIDRDTIRKLSGKGDCFVSGRSETQSASLYDLQKLRSSIAQFRTSVGAEFCAGSLGVPACFIDVFADYGLFSRVQDRDATILAGETIYSQPSWAGFLFSLQVPATASSSGSVVSFSDALRGRINPIHWAAAIKGVISGEIQVCRFEKRAALLDGIYVDLEATANWFVGVVGYPLPNDMELSCLAAEKVTGIHNVLWSKTIRAGFFPGRKSKQSLMIQLRDLYSFTNMYVFGNEVSRKLGIKTRVVSDLMTGSGLAPAARIHNTPLWLREDIHRVFPDFARLWSAGRNASGAEVSVAADLAEAA